MDDDRGRDSAGTPLLERLRATVSRHALLASGDRVLVAVSGGPDSVALLHGIALLGPTYDLTLRVCHVHHGLRSEADRDAELVERLAARLDCPVSVLPVAVRLGAGRSPEEAARAARYEALGRAARAFAASRIALGHTADDQVETVLMRLCQGAGPRGLAGIPIRRGRLIRPLLEVDRAMVRAHLVVSGLPFVEDATNADRRFLRNRIRHELLPGLGPIGGPRPEALLRVARASREAVEALDTLVLPRLPAFVRPGPGGAALDLPTLHEVPPGAAKVLFRLAIRAIAPGRELRAGLRAVHLEALWALREAPIGARVRLPGGVTVERARDALWVAPGAVRSPALRVSVPGEIHLPGSRLTLAVDESPPSPGHPVDPAWEAWFDADLVRSTLEIRPRNPLDRMVPFGGERPVRVSRLLKAAGTAPGARGQWPVLVRRDATGEELLWVIGVRRGAAAPITAGTTAMVRVRAVPDAPPLLGQDGEELT